MASPPVFIHETISEIPLNYDSNYFSGKLDGLYHPCIYYYYHYDDNNIYIYHRFYIVMQDLDQMRRSQDVFPVLPLLWSIVEGPIFEA